MNSSLPQDSTKVISGANCRKCVSTWMSPSFHVINEVQAPAKAVMGEWESTLNGDTTCVQHFINLCHIHQSDELSLLRLSVLIMTARFTGWMSQILQTSP